jgi:branched-chain amino acid aminotransferase
MTFYLSGQFVPEEEAKISVLDRSFLYGDGLFESLRVYNGRIFMWNEHMERFLQGARMLKIELPEPVSKIAEAASRLLEINQSQNAVLRIQLSRGVGRRGYSIAGAESPQLIITVHPAAEAEHPMERWKVWISSIRIPAHDPFAIVKTCNKLPQIIARTEAELEGANEAIMLNTDGLVAEAAASNLFWIEGSTIMTPPLSVGGLAGVARRFVIRLAGELGYECRESALPGAALSHKDGIFLTMSTLEIVEVVEVNRMEVRTSTITSRLFDAYRAAVRIATEA